MNTVRIPQTFYDPPLYSELDISWCEIENLCPVCGSAVKWTLLIDLGQDGEYRGQSFECSSGHLWEYTPDEWIPEYWYAR